jgi:type I restriction enzyme R subunit
LQSRGADDPRLLLKAVLEEGPGWRYLIQHAAGCGKTASIGLRSHLLADLHDANHRCRGGAGMALAAQP